MRWLRSFGAFWWDFVVGDDPWLAAGIVVALGATALLYAIGIPAWWVMPVATAALLSWSATRAHLAHPRAGGSAPDE
jgi:hypothetical protein